MPYDVSFSVCLFVYLSVSISYLCFLSLCFPAIRFFLNMKPICPSVTVSLCLFPFPSGCLSYVLRNQTQITSLVLVFSPFVCFCLFLYVRMSLCHSPLLLFRMSLYLPGCLYGSVCLFTLLILSNAIEGTCCR